MSSKLLVSVVACILTAAGLLTVTGCSTSAGLQPNATGSTSQENSVSGLPAPIAIDLARVSGTVVDIPLGNGAYIIVPEGTESDYTTSTGDELVATVTDGGSVDGAVFRPGIKSVSVGSTDITVTNRLTGRSAVFTVTITPARE